MRKIVAMLTVVLFVVVVAVGFASAKDESAQTFKAGDKIFVCGCGAGCDCGTLSYKAGKCGCGKKMVETKVAKVENGKVYYKVDGKELSAPAKGKYMCGCGPACKCGTISQKPGKCGCGQPMKKVE